MTTETDSMVLDGEPELSTAEKLLFRKMIRDREHLRWAWRRVRWFFPLAAAVVAAAYSVANWMYQHYKP